MRSFSTVATLCACAILVCLVASQIAAASAFYTDYQYEGLAGEPGFEDDDLEPMDKRGEGNMRPVPFPCNGYDNSPRCLHGGKGPRKTWTKSGRFCVCLCPSKWVSPECGYAAGMGGKRAAPVWDADTKDTSAAVQHAYAKRMYPWKILGQGK